MTTKKKKDMTHEERQQKAMRAKWYRLKHKRENGHLHFDNRYELIDGVFWDIMSVPQSMTLARVLKLLNCPKRHGYRAVWLKQGGGMNRKGPADTDISDDQWNVIQAVEQYKKEEDRKFIGTSEIVKVMEAIGWTAPKKGETK